MKTGRGQRDQTGNIFKKEGFTNRCYGELGVLGLKTWSISDKNLHSGILPIRLVRVWAQNRKHLCLTNSALMEVWNWVIRWNWHEQIPCVSSNVHQSNRHKCKHHSSSTPLDILKFFKWGGPWVAKPHQDSSHRIWSNSGHPRGDLQEGQQGRPGGDLTKSRFQAEQLEMVPVKDKAIVHIYNIHTHLDI